MTKLKILLNNLKILDYKLLRILENIVNLRIYLIVQFNYYQKFMKNINMIFLKY